MSAFSVFRPSRFANLLASDAKNISRDPTLMFAILLAAIPAICFSIWRIQIDNAALSAFGLANFTSYAVLLIITLPAFLVGWVTGFLLLEDRDDGPLLALDITPIGKGGFFTYRVTITALITASITLLACWLLLPEIGLARALFVTVLIAIESVCVAFLLPAIARNKVEGLAVTKLLNLATIAPLIALISSPWRFLAGVVPTYWIGEILPLQAPQFLPNAATYALALISHLAFALFSYWLATRRVG